LKALALLAAAAISAAPHTLASAQSTAASYVGGGTLGLWSGSTGWLFTTNVALEVQQLGIWDENGDGLQSTHDIGLFQRSTLLPIVTAQVPAGTAAPLIDGSRFVTIAPVTLLPGTEYYIFANHFDLDRFAWGDTALSFAPQITWLRFVNGPSQSIYATPTFLVGERGDLGPNFRFIPVPGSAAVLMLGAALVRARRRS
jgi:hypothetical protein